MIFDRIILKNMFAYEGEVVFDLSPPSNGRNIVLIEGRNNFGKTSFLNSIKLLYSGITEELREGVKRKRTPSLKAYVIGDDEWWGLLNRRARDAGERYASVCIHWRESNHWIKAERSWEIENGQYYEKLEITGSALSSPLYEQEAKKFLDQRLPAAYVPFFFFDGEQIQQIAEADPQNQISQIERLLDIAPLDELRRTLGKAISEWQKEGASAVKKAELNRLEYEIKQRQDKLSINEQQLKDWNADFEELNSDIASLHRKIETSTKFIQKNDKDRLEQKSTVLGEEREKLRSEVLTYLAREAPLFASRELLESAINTLRPSLRTIDNASETIKLCSLLEQELPDAIFDLKPESRPPLTLEQKEFYRKRLIDRLREYRPSDTDIPNVMNWRLDIPRAQELFNQLNAVLGRPSEAQKHAECLRRLQAIGVELKNIEDELANVEQMDERERSAYDANKITYELKKEKLFKLQVDITMYEKESAKLQNEIKNLEKEHALQKEQLAHSEAIREYIDRAQLLQKLFLQYKTTLKVRHRTRLQGAINRNFLALMDSTKLISQIVIDDDFSLHYKDQQGMPVPNASISAGTKQIIATALLWALKECSGKLLPIVIDTPLGRIDLGNQEKLLTQYYPKIGSQVILLPTDSELDKVKLDLLSSRIYRYYQLMNLDGDHVVLNDLTSTLHR